MRHFVAVLFAIAVLTLLLSPSLAAEKPYWVDAMQSVHAGFQGTTGYVAQFGDSITYSMAFWSPLGWDDPDQYLIKDDGLPKRPQQKWRDVLKGFRAKGPEQGNYSGWRVGDVLKAMDEVLRREKPEAAIIMVGTNDISGGKVPDGYRDGLKKIVQKCLNAHCVPILNTIPPRRGHDAAVEAANRIVREVAQESKAPLADFYAECLRLRPGKSWDKTIISDDGVHPSGGKNQVYTEENLKVCGYALRNWVNFLAVREVYFWALAAPRVKTEEAPQPRARSAEKQTGYDAKFVKMNNIPKKLLAGQVFHVEYTMKNTGNEGWGPDNEKHTVLRSREPDDNKTWGTFFITQGQGTAVPPGKEFTYRSWLMAPSAPGEYVLQWQPAKWEGEGYAGKVTPFGELTPRLVIQVQERPDEPAPPAPLSQAPGEKQVLALDDFEYAGSFKIPDREGHDLPFSHSGLALRKMKDGTKRLFFNYTHPKVALVEVEIPRLVKLDEKHGYAALKAAEVKRVWGKLEIKVPKAKMSNFQDTIWANAGYCWDEAAKTLYWTWTHDYWCGEPPPVLGASRLADDGTITHLGAWTVGPGMYKWYWGGVTRLPQGDCAMLGNLR
jgi:lysophospholipase L1-like esterase